MTETKKISNEIKSLKQEIISLSSEMQTIKKKLGENNSRLKIIEENTKRLTEILNNPEREQKKVDVQSEKFKDGVLTEEKYDWIEDTIELDSK